MNLQQHLDLIEAFGTTEGAEKGWEHRERGHASIISAPNTRDRVREYFKHLDVHERAKNTVSSAKAEIAKAERDYHKARYENSSYVDSKKARRDSLDPIHKRNEEELVHSKDKLKGLQEGLEHPEKGQFLRSTDPKDATYTSPSGDRVNISSFSGYSMQRVAPSYGIAYTHADDFKPNERYMHTGEQKWAGHTGRDTRDNFVDKVFGIKLGTHT